MAAVGVSVRCAGGFARAFASRAGLAAAGSAAAGFAAAGAASVGAGAGLGVGVDQFVEVAARAGSSLLLIDQRETVLVEFGEEFVPIDFFERIVIAVLRFGEAEAQDAGFAVPFGACDFAGDGVARFCPSADLIVVLSGL